MKREDVNNNRAELARAPQRHYGFTSAARKRRFANFKKICGGREP
jgi:hypothetical protein